MSKLIPQNLTEEELAELLSSLEGILDVLNAWREQCPARLARLEKMPAVMDLENAIWQLCHVPDAVIEAEAIAEAAFRQTPAPPSPGVQFSDLLALFARLPEAKQLAILRRLTYPGSHGQ